MGIKGLVKSNARGEGSRKGEWMIKHDRRGITSRLADMQPNRIQDIVDRSNGQKSKYETKNKEHTQLQQFC